MSENELSETQQIESREGDATGCLSSWVIRITLAVMLVIGVIVVIAFVAYMDTRADRGEPIEIRHYPGVEALAADISTGGQSRERYQGFFPNMSALLLTDIEAHYQRQMDKCFRLAEDLNDPASFHTIICEIDRSHDWLGFTQFARLEIKPNRDANGVWTGELNVIVDQRWED